MSDYLPTGKAADSTVEGNPDEIVFELEKVKYIISTSASTYSPEFKTTNYHRNLFKEISKAEDMWNSIKKISLDYGLNLVYPEPDPPSDMDDFSEETVSTDATTTTNVEYSTGTVKIKNDNSYLSLRKTPDGESLANLEQSSKLKVFGLAEENGWIKVKYDNLEGVVSAEYLIIDDTLTQDPNAIVTKTDAESINVYLQEGENDTVLCKLANNTNIKVVEKMSSGQYKIDIFGKTGYIDGDCVQVNEVNS